MSWTDRLLTALSAAPRWSYEVGPAAATEPTALATLAMLGYDRPAEARRGLEWLSTVQAADGSLGVTRALSTPCWPTSLAIIAWRRAAAAGVARDQNRIERAVAWTLTTKGEAIARTEQLGHDSTLVGWPWVTTTHSWVEPTALSVMALKVAGHADHPRTREAVRLLLDRTLHEGGLNYGNTTVLGQELRPHVQPTGISLVALAGENTGQEQVARSALFLEQNLSASTTTASLCWAVLGLAAQGRPLAEADRWLRAAAERTLRRGPSPYKLALLLLAATSDRRLLLPASERLDS